MTFLKQVKQTLNSFTSKHDYSTIYEPRYVMFTSLKNQWTDLSIDSNAETLIYGYIHQCCKSRKKKHRLFFLSIPDAIIHVCLAFYFEPMPDFLTHPACNLDTELYSFTADCSKFIQFSIHATYILPNDIFWNSGIHEFRIKCLTIEPKMDFSIGVICVGSNDENSNYKSIENNTFGNEWIFDSSKCAISYQMYFSQNCSVVTPSGIYCYEEGRKISNHERQHPLLKASDIISFIIDFEQKCISFWINFQKIGENEKINVFDNDFNDEKNKKSGVEENVNGKNAVYFRPVFAFAYASQKSCSFQLLCCR